MAASDLIGLSGLIDDTRFHPGGNSDHAQRFGRHRAACAWHDSSCDPVAGLRPLRALTSWLPSMNGGLNSVVQAIAGARADLAAGGGAGGVVVRSAGDRPGAGPPDQAGGMGGGP